MSMFREMRRRAGQLVGPTLSACLAIYFAFHAIQGDRGMIAWWQLSQSVDAARTTLAEASVRRAVLEHRVGLMRPESLDRDMLDERARLMLNQIGPNEIVVFGEAAAPRR
jgi:cell division protein FtsB